MKRIIRIITYKKIKDAGDVLADIVEAPIELTARGKFFQSLQDKFMEMFDALENGQKVVLEVEK